MLRSLCHRFLVLLLLPAALLWGGCELLEAEPFESEIVVESYQIEGQPLGDVRLSRSVDIDTRFVFEEQAVRGADVRVARLDADDAVVEEVTYLEHSPGVYRPAPETPPTVEPLTTYRLRVSVPETGETLSARTLVPGAFELRSVSADTITFRDAQAQLTLTQSAYPGRQAVYLFSTEALDVEEANLTPFYRNIFENNGDLDDLRIANSGLLNEANFDVADDGLISIDLPWLGIAFYGLNRIFVSAVDDNYFDFIRSQDAQQGGPGFSPGEIPNVIDRVEGGTGLFASLSQIEADLEIRCNDAVDPQCPPTP